MYQNKVIKRRIASMAKQVGEGDEDARKDTLSKKTGSVLSTGKIEGEVSVYNSHKKAVGNATNKNISNRYDAIEKARKRIAELLDKDKKYNIDK